MKIEKTKSLAISRTVSFRNFQSRLGSATYRLNTIFVGLEHVANGADKLTNGAAVTWKKPIDAKAAKQTADQARIFACSAATAFAVDVIDHYLSSLVKEDWLQFPTTVQEIATKAVTRPASVGGAYSIAERAKAISDDLNITNVSLLLALLELLAKWRNASIHSDDRDTKISTEARTALILGKQHLRDNYSHLDIDLALSNFSNKKLPVAKEITSLIAASQNFFRIIDEAAIKRVANTWIGAKQSLIVLMCNHFLNKDENGTPKGARVAEFMQGPSEERKKYLLKTIEPLGITLTTSPISVEFDNSHFDEVLALKENDLILQLQGAYQETLARMQPN